MLAPASNVTEYSVSEISFALKRTVEDTYGNVRVRGEISGLKRAASGHVYLCLKDDKAVLDAVAWRGTASRLGFDLADGLEVVCTGKLTTYPGRSKYQLVVERIEPAGVGALMALLEERKRKLAAEGLFDAARKKALPYLPAVVGVVTSPTGAVIRDILHRLAERFPCRVIVWPVLVQGEGAASQVAEAISGFDALQPDGPVPRPDVLIVARGGGSIEDLWSFNEEIVVRAAAACSIPLISAVGHETDTTLIDHAADRRAPTPTAAAEMAVPVRRELVVQVKSLSERLERAADRELRGLAERLEGLRRGLPEPRQILGLAAQRLDDLAERLRLRSPREVVRDRRERLASRQARMTELVADRLRQAGHHLVSGGGRLGPGPIQMLIRQNARALAREAASLAQCGSVILEDPRRRLDQAAAMLGSLGHERVLERGYAIVRRRPEGQVVPRLAAAEGAVELDIQFADGSMTVQRANGGAARRPKRGGPAAPPPEQESLL
ncbi:exodeoxyribonuclease VII large subunit [Geminicoccaceae bacterium 1502E]|nr:exodeoxyribonuclease VII large subunit [Geminicoccaceae bacterium 1502E]